MVKPQLKALADRLGNATLPSPSPPKEEKKSLPRDADGKPRLSLSPSLKAVVHTPTREAYDLLMRVCECAGYVWYGGDRPTAKDYYEVKAGETCIHLEFTENFTTKKRTPYVAYADRVYSLCHSPKEVILSPEEFYAEQQISPALLEEISRIDVSPFRYVIGLVANALGSPGGQNL